MENTKVDQKILANALEDAKFLAEYLSDQADKKTEYFQRARHSDNEAEGRSALEECSKANLIAWQALNVYRVVSLAHSQGLGLV